ncbi:unnamed protein product [Adineta ricciae]|uniref:Uncharacterized protein n=1 Tax=Adineta ricciae TaxID=249248 RepID=A0A814N1W2_ADIRI|nr:unnamed protein product [Adineta ricciae]
MKAKTAFKWIYKQVSHYNLFMLEENDYDDDDDIADPIIVLKYQKYKTWLYVTLRTVCLYVLFYATLIKIEQKTIVVSNITPHLFTKLFSQHNRTLSCPCRRTSISYEKFLSHHITVHPVCSSTFVDQQWFEGLYFENASLYGVWDFRTTAYSQFELLSKFCSLSNKIVAQIQKDIASTDFISIELVSIMEIRKEADGFIELKKHSASDQMMSYMNYLISTTQENFLATALGTNYIVEILDDDDIGLQIRAEIVLQFDVDGLRPSCVAENPLIAASVSPLSNESIFVYRRTAMKPMSDSIIVQGFFVGCTPLGSLLASRLDCFYDLQCVQLLFDYFPNLNKTYANLNNSILSSHYKNISIMSYLKVLFIEEWSSDIDFSSYFSMCSPSICTYTVTDRTNLVSVLTLFISLYGGLTIILRLIASYSLGIVFNLKTRSGHQHKTLLTTLRSIKKFNVFKNIHDRTQDGVRQQQMITRIYFILLFGSICSLCLFVLLSKASVTVLEPSPAFEAYNSLESIHSSTLRCPCSNKAIPYKNFLSFSPVFHSVCSSSFVHKYWIEILKLIRKSITHDDWRKEAYVQFQILSDLCQLANRTITDVIDRFVHQFFIVSSVLNETNFAKQLDATLDQFYQSTFYNFILLKDIASLIMQVDQFYMGTKYMSNNPAELRLSINVTMDETSDCRVAQVQFAFYTIQELNSTSSECICAINPHCQNPSYIFESNFDHYLNKSIPSIWNIPGWMEACFPMGSLLLSTLQCLYQDSDCFPILMGYLGLYEKNPQDSLSSFDLRLLAYDPTRDRHPPNKSFSAIVKQLMIEQWNPVSSYEHFYESCAPLYCSYPQISRKASFIGVIIRLVSMIGGLVVSLRLLTPLLVKLLRTTLVELNIFTLRNFGASVDRITAKHYGRWATRLYLILFSGGLSILLFYGVAQPQPSTTKFDQPKFAFYNDLRKRYGENLKCTCSVIASNYYQFVQIEPIFHPICKSQFVSDERRLNLVNRLALNLTKYAQRDYRRFLSAHLQYLQGLCRLSMESVNNTIHQLLTSLLVTVDLLSENSFQEHVTMLTEHSKSSAPVALSRFLLFSQTIFHGNTFMSSYGTNFEYVYTKFDDIVVYVATRAVKYDDGCSCGTSLTCTTQAAFIEWDFSRATPVDGMKMGCTPSQSFLSSTLQCFYNQSCLNLIQHYTNSNTSLDPLLTEESRFSRNITIAELVNHVFLEDWSIEKNYSLYYQQCSPLICSYTTVKRLNIFYIITLILGLQGGLTIVLKWTCPKVILLGFKIYNKRKNRATAIHPTMTDDTTVRHTTSKSEIEPQNNGMSCSRWFPKIICSVILIVCVAVGISCFSIYYAYKNYSATTDALVSDNFTTTTITATISTTSNASDPLCLFKYEQVSIDSSCSLISSSAVVVTDVTADDHIDLIFHCDSTEMVHILLGYGNSSFRRAFTFSVRHVYKINWIRVADLNNDRRADLVLAYYDHALGKTNVTVVFGNGNGTFQTHTTRSFLLTITPQETNIIDVNSDTKLDIIAIGERPNHIYIYYGNGDGTFSLPLVLYIGINSNAHQLSVADINNDAYLDLIAMDGLTNLIHAFFGNNDTSFQLHKWFFVFVNTGKTAMIVADFRGDSQSDIILAQSWTNTAFISYRYTNDTFHAQKQIVMDSSVPFRSVALGDLNNDKYLDIVVTKDFPYETYGFLQDRNGNFQVQLIHSSEHTGYLPWTDVKDFNNDNCQDIISISPEFQTMSIFLNTCECP